MEMSCVLHGMFQRITVCLHNSPKEMSHELPWYVSKDHSLHTQQPLPAASSSLGPCVLADLHGYPGGTPSFCHKETVAAAFLRIYLCCQ